MTRIAIGLVVLAAGSNVHAFSDPDQYAAPAELGGGGGRHFTGSPADGFTCGVCHRGGEAPILEVSGLPTVIDRGASYHVAIHWTLDSEAAASYALQLELLTPNGSHPDVAIAPPEALVATQRCDQLPDGPPAVYAVDAGSRRIVGVEDCGATSLEFSFTAPDAADIVFALAAVRSDRSGTADGDGAFEMRTTLHDTRLSGGCAAAGSGTPPAGAIAFAIAIICCLRRRRRLGCGQPKRRGLVSLDCKQPSQLKCPNGIEADKREVVEPAESRARANDERCRRVCELEAVQQFSSQLVGKEGRQLAIAGGVAQARSQVEIVRAIEPRVVLRVVAIVGRNRGRVRHAPCQIGRDCERAHTPVVKIESPLEPNRQPAVDRMATARVDRVSHAQVGNLLGNAVRRARSAHRVTADRNKSIRTRLKAVEDRGLPRQLRDGGAAQDLSQRGACSQTAQRLAEERIARATYGVETAEQVERKCRVPGSEIAFGAQHQPVRPIVRLERVAVACRESVLAAFVADASTDVVAKFANRWRSRSHHVDRCAGPRIDRVARLRADIARLANDLDTGRQHARRIAVGAPVHCGGGARQLASVTGARGDGTSGRSDHNRTESHARILAFTSLLSTVVAAFAIATSGCFQPSDDVESDDAVARPTDLFGAAGGDAVPPPDCPSKPSPLSALHIRVRTSNAGGRFAPRNVGAIWIERSDGSYVKTVARWGTVRTKWLTRFVAAAQNNVVDAVTGPTLIAHQQHDVTWNLTGLDRCEVPSGDYRVVFELTDRNGSGPSLDVALTKSQAPETRTPAGTPQFHDLVLTFE